MTLSCFMVLRNLWFLRQMSLVFSFAYFKFKGLALGFTHVESSPLSVAPTTLSNRLLDGNFQFTSHSHKIWNCNQDHADTD